MVNAPQLSRGLKSQPKAPPDEARFTAAARPIRRILPGRIDLASMFCLAALTLAVSLVTGLTLALYGDIPSTVPITVLSWHLYSIYILICGTVAYGFFLWRAGYNLRIRFSIALLMSAEGNIPWAALQRLLYWLEIACLAIQGLSVTLRYFAPGLAPHQYVIHTHQAITWALLACLVFHVGATLWRKPRFCTIAIPRAAYPGIGWLVLTAAALGLLATYLLDQATQPTLIVARVHQSPSIDGERYDFVWQQARPIKIHTAGGANFPGGEATVKIRGVHDGERLYLLVEWTDMTRSQKHLPLIKTAKGWKVVETGYDKQDENSYYEDKLGMRFSPASTQSKSVLPPGTLSSSDRLTVQESGSLDVWQWQSVRMGAPAQLDDRDDALLSQRQSPKTGYTAEHAQAPQEAEDFALNWTKLPGSPFVLPQRLPKDMQSVQTGLGLVNLDPRIGDYGQWWMALEDTVPYAPELDTYPLGTVLPSVLIDKPLIGDRGDTRGVGIWENGWWRLEISRKLQTGSPFDLPLQTGVALWVTVFDHSQSRPSRHVRPLRLVFE